MKKIHLDGCVTQDIIDKVNSLLSGFKSGEKIMQYLSETEPILMREISRFINSSMESIQNPPPLTNGPAFMNKGCVGTTARDEDNDIYDPAEEELREIEQILANDDELNGEPMAFQTSNNLLFGSMVGAAFVSGYLIARESFHNLFKDMIDIDALLPGNG